MSDLLLFNATNLPWRPIFPYAFVQVSAIARRHGLTVKVVDLLDVPRDRWRAFLKSHLDEHRPRMVGLHIRQGDSVFLDDYAASPNGPDTRRRYFPIDDNRALIEELRRLTDAPIIAGGFGFTTHAQRLFELLGVDYGVEGDPDDVFARFEDVVAGRGEGVKGLLYKGGVNERGYYAPYEGIEYTDGIVDELTRFYGHAQLFGANPPTVAVEVMRGCPFRCFFCTEPHVKGRSLRYRSLDVVEEELERLVHRNLRRFWLICSELDTQGVKFGLALAERIVKLRERTGGAPIEWSAYALPRLEVDELRVLQRAGYMGALNDVLSLDDANLRAAGVPYRSKQAVAFLKAVTALDREEAAASAANAEAAEAKVRAGLTQRTPKELASIFGLFLGNAFATPSSIATTLRRIEDEGLRESYRMGLAFPATRVFAPAGLPICETTPRGLRTYGPDGERATDFAHPTFYYPDFLIERLGSPEAVIDFMRYVGETFMSVGHRARKDWAWFLGHHISQDDFAQLAASLPEPPPVHSLYFPPPSAKPPWNARAKAVIDQVIQAQPEAAARVRSALGITEDLNEYKLAAHLYDRFTSRDAVVAAVAPATTAERFYLDWLLYANNVQLRAEYRELLFGAPS